jgi:hypothetical protein
LSRNHDASATSELIKHIALATAAIVASGIEPAARGRRRALALSDSRHDRRLSRR